MSIRANLLASGKPALEVDHMKGVSLVDRADPFCQDPALDLRQTVKCSSDQMTSEVVHS